MADRSQSPESASGGKPKIKWGDAFSKGRAASESLASILRYFPPHLSSSETPATALLQDPDVASQISSLLRRPESGAVNDNLCAWLYDTFHSSEPGLQLVVLRFIPILAGVYLTRAALNKPLPGFESVLLAIYSHETNARGDHAVTVNIPDLSHPSVYHETKQPAKNASTELHLAVITPALDPHGTVRSTRRARIVGVALELYYSKISQIPVGSKLEFCEFCRIWSGQNSHEKKEGRRGRINLPWELLQPILRILGHCMFRPEKSDELFQAASAACRSLNTRAQLDTNAKAMLATGSLVKIAEMAKDPAHKVDYTEIAMTNDIVV